MQAVSRRLTQHQGGREVAGLQALHTFSRGSTFLGFLGRPLDFGPEAGGHSAQGAARVTMLRAARALLRDRQ